MNILIKNGTIVNSSDSIKSDIYIRNGRIISIGHLKHFDFKPDYEIEADGFYIFPGGVDPHVHMQLPTPAGFSSDNSESGAKASLAGGTTSLIDFVTPYRGQSILDALRIRKDELKNSFIDYKYHVSPVEWNDHTENEIIQCIEKEKIRSFKVYMAYKNAIGLDEDSIFKVMKVVGKAGGMVLIHAELGDEIESFRNQFIEKGKNTPEFHALSRPPEFEYLAVKKAIDIAAKADCILYIVHVSTKESVNYIRNAKQTGQIVYAETCPQYLLLDHSKYYGTSIQVLPYIISPPLRSVEDQEALWQGISDGTVQSIGTDHCPFNLSQKEFGINDFRNIPNGAGGVEHRLALLYTYGFLQNRISINRFVDLVSTNPAKIFGLYPLKGIIEAGSDADLVVWNPKIEQIISAKTHHQKCDINVFEGFKTIGRPEYVILNGRITNNF